MLFRSKGYGDAGASWHKKATKGFRAMSGSPKEDIQAFIYLTFIIYYISQKRSRDLTLIDQYFLECKNTLKRQGAILTSNTKLLASGDLLEVPFPKRRSQPSTRSKDFLYQTILQAQNGDAQASYGKYVYHQSF